VFSFQRLLHPQTASPFAQFLFPVVGAREFHAGRGPKGPADWNSVGIKSPVALSLVLELEQPCAYLLELAATTALLPVNPKNLKDMHQRFPQRWMAEWLKPQNLVTNGPYTLGERRINDRIRLVRNPKYWDTRSVAFDSIDALAIEQGGTALNMYLTGGCDWLDGGVPSMFVGEMLGREDFRPADSPYLGLYFYRLNCTQPPLNDVRVRRALYLTTPRDLICDQLLKAGQQRCMTFVPWGRLGSYESPYVPGEDLPEARKLMASAGFTARKPLGPLAIHYNTSESHRDIAEIIGDVWKTAFGVDVRFANQEWKVWLDSQNRLDYQISRSSWIADYADASSFLGIFTSDNPNNRTGWKNAQFDALIARSEVEMNPIARNKLLHAAETILIAEVPAIPIYSYVAQNVVNPRLGGFGNNMLNEQNPKFWYWKDDEELWQERRARVGALEFVAAPGPAQGRYSVYAQKMRER
jgi:oligopeptide transport system substrate-binding protein